MSGTDVDGEEISVNKVAAALQTAGINLNEFFIGAKGLDDILFELADKWDTLSITQQRYIATMAAGSRRTITIARFLNKYSFNCGNAIYFLITKFNK